MTFNYIVHRSSRVCQYHGGSWRRFKNNMPTTSVRRRSEANMECEVVEDVLWVELPAEMLRRVLYFVPTRDLLAGAAGVCRSWREAALDPSVWRHRTYPSCEDGPFPPYSILNAVLSVAPCLRTLEVGSNYLNCPGALELLSSTSCAVEDLVCSSTEDWDFFPDLYVYPWEPIVLRQVSLGRLESLRLSLDIASAAKLMHAIDYATLTQLELKLSDCNVEPLAESDTLTRKASLKRLTYSSMDWTSVMLLEHHLELNTDTLEVVEIIRGTCSLRTLELIRQCTRLYKLMLRNDVDVSDTLQSCVNLRSLYIVLVADPSLLLPYFQQATALTELRISHRSNSNWIVLVLRALSSSGRSALQELWLDCLGCDGHLDRVPATLAGLPMLRRLRLFGACTTPSRFFLKAINPIIAPNLRLFEVFSESVFCLPALYCMMMRNPKMRVVDTSEEGQCVRPTTCTSCQNGLHFERRRELSRKLFGHWRKTCNFNKSMRPKKKGNLNIAWVSAAGVSYNTSD